MWELSAISDSYLLKGSLSYFGLVAPTTQVDDLNYKIAQPMWILFLYVGYFFETDENQKFTTNSWRRKSGPTLWAQLAFQGVSKGDLFAHLKALWAPLGTLGGPPGSLLEDFGVPRLSFWSPLGTM